MTPSQVVAEAWDLITGLPHAPVQHLKGIKWGKFVPFVSRKCKDLRIWLDQRTWLRSVGQARDPIQFATFSQTKSRSQLLRERIFEAIQTYYDPLDETFRPPEELKRVYEAVGIRFSEYDNKLGELDNDALLAWKIGGDPEVNLHPTLKQYGIKVVNFALNHELFHQLSSTGLALHDNPLDPKEVLADRFATEMTVPTPAAVQAAKTDLDMLLDTGTPVVELLKTTERQVIVINLPLVLTRGRSITVQAPRKFMSTDSALAESWDAILAWAPGSGFRRPLWQAGATKWVSRDPNFGVLNYASKDGLFYSKGSDEYIWRMLVDGDVLDGVELGHGPTMGYRKVLPEICVEDLTIRGGEHLLVSFLRAGYAGIGNPLTVARVLYIVEDMEGKLDACWRLVDSQTKTGPILPPCDPLDERQPTSFEEWRATMETKFFTGASPDGKLIRRRTEPVVKAVVHTLDEAMEYVLGIDKIIEAIRSTHEGSNRNIAEIIEDALRSWVAKESKGGNESAKVVSEALAKRNKRAPINIDDAFMLQAMKVENTVEEIRGRIKLISEAIEALTIEATDLLITAFQKRGITHNVIRETFEIYITVYSHKGSEPARIISGIRRENRTGEVGIVNDMLDKRALAFEEILKERMAKLD